MARMVRVPSFVRRYFTPSELSGWMPGVQYTTQPRRKERRRKRRTAEAVVYDAPPARKLEVGVSVVR